MAKEPSLAVPTPDRIASELEQKVTTFTSAYGTAHELLYGISRSAEVKVSTGNVSDPTRSAATGNGHLKGKFSRATRKHNLALRILQEGIEALEDLFELADSDPPPLETGEPRDINAKEEKRLRQTQADRQAGNKSPFKGPGYRHDVT